MAADRKPLEMRAGEAKARDVGKKRARIGPAAMNHLGATPGDVVQVRGARSTCVVVWPADEEDGSDGVVRIDGQTRKNAGASLGDAVTVSKARASPAKAVSLAPASDSVAADGEFTDFVKNRLKGMPLSQGDEISVMILGNSINFKVSKCSPRSAVRVGDSTSLSIRAGAAGPQKPQVTYEEVGGHRAKIAAMREIVELPLRHPELFSRLGVEPHSGIMMYGPPGCGKTLIARVLASESEATMYSINGPEIMNKYYGESEARLRDIFKEAKDNSPSIVFIDEMDAIAPKREDAYSDVEKRVVAQLLALMDGLSDRGNVIVLGATNRPDSVDPALRRPGRFDREVEISVPDADGRLEVLQIHTRGMPVAESVDLRGLASDLHGYTGADIKSLCREAAMRSVRRYLPEIDLETERIPSEVLQSMEIKLIDFYEAMREVVPTAMREFYVERPKVWWSDVGGLGGVKASLRDNLMAAMADPSRFSRMGVRPPRGALVYGPPGCGKTMLARALATESGANMVLVRGPEILSKWVGDSERAIREIFRKAKASAPCVVIFDELDSLVRPRAGPEEGGRGPGEGVLGQLLTEIEDGASSRVVVLGITSRPDLLDRSLLRTGRLDLSLYVPPPDEAGRAEIMRILSAGMPLAGGVKLKEVAVSTKGYTGADLASLCREAAVSAMQDGRPRVGSADFSAALGRVGPSATPDVDQWYESVRKGMLSAVPRPRDKEIYR